MAQTAFEGGKKALLTPDKDNVSQWNEIQDDCEHTEGNNGQPA